MFDAKQTPDQIVQTKYKYKYNWLNFSQGNKYKYLIILCDNTKFFFLVILFVSYLSTFDNNLKISCRKTKWIHPFLSEEIDDWVVHPKVAHSWKDQIKKQSSHNLFLCRPKKLFCAMFVPFSKQIQDDKIDLQKYK